MRKRTLPDKILTHEDMFRLPYGVFVRGMATKKSMRPPGQDGVTGGAPIRAYINHGKWVVECPDCTGAQVVSEEERRFWCVSCGNATINFAWRHVRLPRDRDKIEAALVVRPAARADKAITRNWNLDETVADLEQENVDHGVERDS